jgi:hypothetical protein
MQDHNPEAADIARPFSKARRYGEQLHFLVALGVASGSTGQQAASLLAWQTRASLAHLAQMMSSKYFAEKNNDYPAPFR